MEIISVFPPSCTSTGSPVFPCKQRLAQACQTKSRREIISFLFHRDNVTASTLERSRVCRASASLTGQRGLGRCAHLWYETESYNLSISDLLMDGLINKDSFDPLYMVMLSLWWIYAVNWFTLIQYLENVQSETHRGNSTKKKKQSMCIKSLLLE